MKFDKLTEAYLKVVNEDNLAAAETPLKKRKIKELEAKKWEIIHKYNAEVRAIEDEIEAIRKARGYERVFRAGGGYEMGRDAEPGPK